MFAKTPRLRSASPLLWGGPNRREPAPERRRGEMKMSMIGCVAVFGLGPLACVAPGEQDDGMGDVPAEDQASADGESTGVVTSELRNGDGGACGTTCASDNGSQTCCCEVGDRCVKGVTFCKCE